MRILGTQISGRFHETLRNWINVLRVHFMAQLMQQNVRYCVVMRYKPKWRNLSKISWTRPLKSFQGAIESNDIWYRTIKTNCYLLQCPFSFVYFSSSSFPWHSRRSDFKMEDTFDCSSLWLHYGILEDRAASVFFLTVILFFLTETVTRHLIVRGNALCAWWNSRSSIFPYP